MTISAAVLLLPCNTERTVRTLVSGSQPSVRPVLPTTLAAGETQTLSVDGTAKEYDLNHGTVAS
jgi:hypothetical protein